MGTLLKKTEDSEIKTHRIPIVVRTLTTAHRSKIPSMIFSLALISSAHAASGCTELQYCQILIRLKLIAAPEERK